MGNFLNLPTVHKSQARNDLGTNILHHGGRALAGGLGSVLIMFPVQPVPHHFAFAGVPS